jgi:putative aldouronate transport system permease protein
MPLQIVLRQLLFQSASSLTSTTFTADAAQTQQYIDQIKYALIIVSTLPILCVYPFVQKYFVKGIMIGSFKG